MQSIRAIPTTLTTLLAAGLVLSACSGSTESTSPSDDTVSMSENMGTMGGDDQESFAFGEPAAEAESDRTVEIATLDSLVFEPSGLEVAAGETITFVVTNPGAAPHEFVIGDMATQEEHEAEMQEMMGSGMQMGDESNAILLPPGETKRITWHFTMAGTIEFACHQPGHYAGGMKGMMTVS